MVGKPHKADNKNICDHDLRKYFLVFDHSLKALMSTLWRRWEILREILHRAILRDVALCDVNLRGVKEHYVALHCVNLNRCGPNYMDLLRSYSA